MKLWPSLLLGCSSRNLCQAPTKNPLEGCPKGTILVSATSSSAHYKTIQSAIDSLPHDSSSHTILIEGGSYFEQLNITRPGPLYLLGQTSHPDDATRNEVTVLQAKANNATYPDNVYASVLIVAPTLNASLTGAGPNGYPLPANTPFGCKDFRTYNIDFRNVAAEQSAGPSHAVSFSMANGGFYFSGFYSYQDTVYVGKNGSAYFYKSVAAGQTDFLYGFGTAWFQSCDIQMRNCGGGVTAWKGTNTTFLNHYGVYIVDSHLAAANASIAPSMVGMCALGRPWNSNDHSIFARTYEDASIRPQGYIEWSSPIDNYTLMAEYKAYGPGFNRTGRIEGGIDHLLTDKQYEPYSTPAKVFQYLDGTFGNDKWIDKAYYPK
ncbi:putative pectin methylesterase [Rhizodiscina lignyota]|uniref:pectinesterase n=1 Tax=Rhizodiscina lignyota TaxID=1504668 RepID=A0A9P4IBE2_9PEZI|nr:putative pectin methylesterase [Rhizodiscina lignyota]